MRNEIRSGGLSQKLPAVLTEDASEVLVAIKITSPKHSSTFPLSCCHKARRRISCFMKVTAQWFQPHKSEMGRLVIHKKSWIRLRKWNGRMVPKQHVPGMKVPFGKQRKSLAVHNGHKTYSHVVPRNEFFLAHFANNPNFHPNPTIDLSISLFLIAEKNKRKKEKMTRLFIIIKLKMIVLS